MNPAPHARDALAMASFAALCLLALLVVLPDGPLALARMAGVPGADASATSIRWVLAGDTLMPIGYGAGFVLLAFALGGAGRFALVTSGFALTGVAFDFVENGAALAGTAMPMATVAKYGLLGIAAFLLGAGMDGRNAAERLARPIAKFVTPVFLAVTITKALGEWTVWLFVPTLVATFALLAAVAHGRIRALRESL